MNATEERLVLNMPKGTLFAVEQAAVQAHLSPGELARRLVLDGLAANGFDLPRRDGVSLRIV